MLDETARGVFTIAVTPFLPNGALDEASLDRMVDFYLEKGATGLTILGMMGEAGKLSAEESLTVVRRVVARAPVPVVVGVSSPGFAAMQALSGAAMDAGAAGVMVAPPGNLRTDDQIIGYYRTAAEMLGDSPFVLQDFPLVTGVTIAPKVIERIVADCPTCVMLKHEDWPGLDKISALRAASDAGGRRISILCGNGGLFLLEEMLRGADGAMTGFAYPEMMAHVIAAFEAGDEARARDIFDAYLPLVRYESQPGLGLAIRKHTLAKRGAIAHATVRKPGGALSAATIAEVEALISRQEARLAALEA
ncbi:MAG: dihydrodipicolinate synthase family protein [Rhodobacteraceae bacterium]|nr:dihydrodipicolinate synthase family protein [Alphaproteobacteria bacterium]NNK66843.1 dihydrodipicolinate synthase family protein [Paracoccaceae bacterium]